MRKHILIEKAFAYECNTEDRKPTDCNYSAKDGFWRLNTTGEPLMMSDNPRKPQTKKADVETGEDRKGE